MMHGDHSVGSNHRDLAWKFKKKYFSYLKLISPVILWFDPGLIAREGFSNVSYSKKCALQHTKSLKKFSEGKA